jgi:hypothetical protein
MAKLTGLITYFVYWLVLGKYNQLPIDSYHRTLIFLTIQRTLNEISTKYNTSKAFSTLFMPMIILSIRRVVDIAFHSKYPLLFANTNAGNIATNKISLLLTKLLDPNVLYSRFSSLKSGSSAIAFKLKQYNSAKSRRVQDLFYTNSALVNSLLVRRSEGSVRIRFSNPYSPECSPHKKDLSRVNQSTNCIQDNHFEKSRSCKLISKSSGRSSIRSSK